MTARATHRESDVSRALRAAAKAPGQWQVELLPSGAICIVPSADKATCRICGEEGHRWQLCGNA
jgi:hypothetical protein